ncbi:MAG: hypothetical protein HQL36_03640 [Alphaproteobacteria bacterium]|nr:hypothetical protein [Alphaproteobacteria bacterium]MBF0249923.1 hypothetical protein [Alphaproteobacteria bacterium]
MPSNDEKSFLIAELGVLASELEINQINAIVTFAVMLRLGGVTPAFFSQIADALEGRGGEQ